MQLKSDVDYFLRCRFRGTVVNPVLISSLCDGGYLFVTNCEDFNVLDISDFPKGFVLASAPGEVPEHFVRDPVLPNLLVEPSLERSCATNKESFVIVLGICVPAGDYDFAVAEELLLAHRRSRADFYEFLGKLVGRFVVIFGEPGNIEVTADATAMRSIFYAEGGGVVSSHALLVARWLEQSTQKESIPFGNGFPGDRTPYIGVRILTANISYNLSTGRVTRVWPVRALSNHSLEDASHAILDLSSAALRNAANGRPVKLALTAGIDSRLALAVAVHSGIDFETYTYGESRPDTRIDRLVAAEVSDLLGVAHTIPESIKAAGPLRKKLNEAHYSAHHPNSVAGLDMYFSDRRTLSVAGNLLELGREHYSSAEGEGLGFPDTAEKVAAVYYLRTGRKTKELIDRFGKDDFDDVSTSYFREWVSKIGGFQVEYLNPLTQFYWEHRMATWFGPAMNERDFYAEAFVAFNSREIFEYFLGVERSARMNNETFYKIIGMVEPKLLDIPINPKAWPPKFQPKSSRP